ncbi:ATP phosphoribosyltransferase regulatory subunit [Alkalimarinus sediminis]|uniref:ATP phosphoribosyltransferase regulatory subunit n=1 Tax=Alkalimarinus sediminis TaxID=1632866 RepID=A0A9E8KIN0_9ALTE|nr:ATP phosphoribosyltransferase regulatory subunit [Alkalimarinus sediminis]UZW74091.1 ATP phosphoribosyltransferase regulatory subunit [Alkalimarinus sediminis]
MTVSDRWLLPDGVDELLPPNARVVEQLRRRLLDNISNWGYELITPPMIEFLESLLTGTGNDLNLQTLKVTDQLSGRLMGIRADITPQAARIDAHCLRQKGVTRLCYADAVIHARPAHLLTNRCPIQLGCELFGEASLAADIEVISLMLDTLKLAGLEKVHVDLSHVGIYRGLISKAGFERDTESAIFDAIRRKSIPELDELLSGTVGDVSIAKMLLQLANASGGVDAIKQIKSIVAGASSDVLNAVEQLESICDQLQQRYPNVELGFDFCELRGYNYHTGLVFAAYYNGYGHAVAQGGRYDAIGKEFGSERSATGFSADLKILATLASPDGIENKKGILAPFSDDNTLWDAIEQLRRSEKVVQSLSVEGEKSDAVKLGCDRELVKENGSWVVKPI